MPAYAQEPHFACQLASLTAPADTLSKHNYGDGDTMGDLLLQLMKITGFS